MPEDIDRPEVSMVRVLLVLAIGIPIVIEVVTFGGLLGHYLGGDAGAATPTPETAGTPSGDEILPETGATERIDRVTVTDGENATRLTLTVTVTGPPDGYELRLGAVTTRTGRTVADAAATTGTLSAGERGVVTGTWQLPAGQRPETLAVTVVTAGDGTPTTAAHTVDLGAISAS